MRQGLGHVAGMGTCDKGGGIWQGRGRGHVAEGGCRRWGHVARVGHVAGVGACGRGWDMWQRVVAGGGSMWQGVEAKGRGWGMWQGIGACGRGGNM